MAGVFLTIGTLEMCWFSLVINESSADFEYFVSKSKHIDCQLICLQFTFYTDFWKDFPFLSPHYPRPVVKTIYISKVF